MSTFSESNLFLHIGYKNGKFDVEVISNNFEMIKYDINKKFEE